MALWDDEGVAAGEGADVEDGQVVLVLVDPYCRGLSCDDRAEHTGHSARLTLREWCPTSHPIAHQVWCVECRSSPDVIETATKSLGLYRSSSQSRLSEAVHSMANHFAPTFKGRNHFMKKQSRSSLRRSSRPSSPSQPQGQQYSGIPPQSGYGQPYDWRYATQQPQPSYGPYGAVHQPDSTPTSPIPLVRKRSRTGTVVVGAAAVAVVSGGIGAAVLVNHSDPSAANSAATAATAAAPAPKQPVAAPPSGSVEQVAAKVLPSVVKLQIKMGQGAEEGSGIVLSSDGLILTNNHVVAALSGPAADQASGVFGGQDDQGFPGLQGLPGMGDEPSPGEFTRRAGRAGIVRPESGCLCFLRRRQDRAVHRCRHRPGR